MTLKNAYLEKRPENIQPSRSIFILANWICTLELEVNKEDVLEGVLVTIIIL